MFQRLESHTRPFLARLRQLKSGILAWSTINRPQEFSETGVEPSEEIGGDSAESAEKEYSQRLIDYKRMTSAVFGKPLMPITDSSFKLASSIPTDSLYFEAPGRELFNAELAICQDLITDIKIHGVPGDLVEFGIFRGDWLNHLFQLMKATKLNRQIWGFDSFQGLSSPSQENDDPFWKQGMFSAGLEEVRKLTQADLRPELRLVPGFFEHSLDTEEAQSLHEISFARIDCDIYQPSVECLRYLSERLSHGSVLVFDDWSHRTDYGETRAFFEWVPTVPDLEFEFLFLGVWDHLYIRVWHRNKHRWPWKI